MSKEREHQLRADTPHHNLLNQFLTDHNGQHAIITLKNTQQIDVILNDNYTNNLLAVKNANISHWLLIPISKIVVIECQN